MSKADDAKTLFKSGANCSQAVILAFHEDCGISREVALKLGAPFGGGMGRLREVCGAVTGMFTVLGLKYGYTDLQDKAAKDRHYALIQKAAQLFKKETGSLICRELLGIDHKHADPSVSEERTETYYKKRPCAEMVFLAATILEQIFSEKEDQDKE